MTEFTPPTPARQLRSEPGATLASVFSQAGFLLVGGVDGGRPPDEPLEIQLPPARIMVRPIEGGEYCWSATARLPWPRGIDQALWSRALLAANGGLMRHGCMAFALDEIDFLVLSGRLYGSRNHTGVARQLRAFHEVWTNTHQLATACHSSPLACDELERFIAPHESGAGPDVHREDTGQLLIDKLIEMGTDPLQACQIAASGRIQLDDADVQVEASADGAALLLSVRLGHALLDGEGMAALRLAGELMDRHAIAMAHGADGHRLTAHWPCNGRPVAELQECLNAMAGLPGVLQSERTVYDPADTDFDALMPFV